MIKDFGDSLIKKQQSNLTKKLMMAMSEDKDVNYTYYTGLGSPNYKRPKEF